MRKGATNQGPGPCAVIYACILDSEWHPVLGAAVGTARQFGLRVEEVEWGRRGGGSRTGYKLHTSTHVQVDAVVTYRNYWDLAAGVGVAGERWLGLDYHGSAPLE